MSSPRTKNIPQNIPAANNLRGSLASVRVANLKPPPRLDLVQWADQNRRVSPKNSANPGRWDSARQPVAVGIMLAVNERDTNTITVEAGTQILKSEFLINVAGYFIDQDPSPILFLQPTQTLAKGFARERWDPTRDVTPCLRDKIADRKARKSDNTITHKDYPGGTMDFVGANSPVDLASRPKRIVLSDEIDKYPESAGNEGDPLKLAEERSSTFWNRKFARVCSPTIKGESRIDEEYRASDQRRCFVACPHCGHRQTMKWPQVQWEKDENGVGLPETAAYFCEDCGVGWTEAERVAAIRGVLKMSDKGWRQTAKFKCCGEEHAPTKWDRKGRALCPECGEAPRYNGHAGFHASKLLSIRHRMQDLVREWLDCHRDTGDGADTIEKLKKFINTALAEVFEERGTEAESEGLLDRAEDYTPDELPDGVHFATMGVDVQHDRLECEVVGWGLNDESWAIKYEVILGDYSSSSTWKALDTIRKERFYTRSGRLVKVRATAVDVNDEQTTAYAYGYCSKRKGALVYPIRGRAGGYPIFPENKRKSRTKTGQLYYACGSDAAKGWFYGSLKIEEPGPRYPHFPLEYTDEWAAQATSEKVMTVRDRNGRRKKTWVLKKGQRNEALDCRAYAIMAMKSLTAAQRRPSRVIDPNQVSAKNADGQPDDELDNDTENAVKAPKRRKRTRQVRRRGRSGGFVKGF